MACFSSSTPNTKVRQGSWQLSGTDIHGQHSCQAKCPGLAGTVPEIMLMSCLCPGLAQNSIDVPEFLQILSLEFHGGPLDVAISKTMSRQRLNWTCKATTLFVAQCYNSRAINLNIVYFYFLCLHCICLCQPWQINGCGRACVPIVWLQNLATRGQVLAL